MLSRISLLFLFFFLCSTVYGQESKKLPLKEILKQAETERGIRFSYADETIDGLMIILPDPDLSLQQFLSDLSLQTRLKFSLISERSIAISPLLAKAGMICGVLYDAREKTPVDIATIVHGSRYTLSDSSGYFEIKRNKGEEKIIMQRNGYLTQEIILSDNDSGPCPQIFLTPEVRELEEVKVYKLLTRGINREPGGNIELDVANLGLLPGLTEPDVLQSIQALPGIQSINETISDINIRGGTNDQNLVLWDGIKMYQTGHFFGLISAFNPYLNNKVKIIKNGSSAGYGDGVSGTIDIQSDDLLVDGVQGGAGLNMINADAYIKLPLGKKVTLQLAGRRSITDLVKTPMFNNYFERVFRNTDVTRYSTAGTDTTFNSDENFYFYDISANLLVDLTANDRLNLNFVHFFNDLQYQEDINLSGTDDSKTSRLRQQSLAGSLLYKRRWSNKLRSSLLLSLSSYELYGVNFDIPGNQRVIQENEVLDLGLKIDTRWLLNQRWDFLFGYQLAETGVANLEEVNNPEFFRYIKQVILTHALFAETNYSPVPGTRLRLGVRGNYLAKFDRLLFEPRMALSQQLGQRFSVELLGEFKHQTATQVVDLQNDFLGVESRRWILSNEADVPIVRSRQLSTAILYQIPELLISVEGFYKYVSGITSASQAFQNQFQLVRTSGNYEIYGAEFLVNWKNDVLSAWTSYTIADNHYLFPELVPSEFANNLDIRHSINAGLTWYWRDLEASTGINWHTGKPFTMASSLSNGQIQYERPNQRLLPDYFRMDLSVRYNFNLGQRIRGQIGGSVWNLTNHRNLFNVYYQEDGDNNLSQIEQVALGITPNVSLRLKF